MRISNILVSVDLGAAATDRIRLAADVAGRFEATLTGVAARQLVTMIPVESPDASERVFEIEETRAKEDLAEARALFVRETGDRVRTAWRGALAEPLAYLVEQARAADLVVVGRLGPADGDPGLMGVAAGGLLMEVGRPVLVAPPGFERLAAKRVVVAWKDTREARRAVHDALPFLVRAEQVHVAVAGHEARREGGADVAAYLASHGVSVATRLLHQPEIGAADEILRFARREDADLIVMGAYGHSRLREWVFGGATRDMLQGTSLCCLMSH
ncbi:universal stress protein [Methylobacterium radiotolerans]|uniref:universal stress protein n=1 Tax=Methylobacterium radiotolerans TaxID=31998 RepID=UPI00097651B5|nr:universal stress protein [Methylobacterium radiotolerans]ONF49076.1 universal stress protein UspA [Methylobacterium radiotolerans]